MSKKTVFLSGLIVLLGALMYTQFGFDGENVQGRLTIFSRIRQPWAENFDPNPETALFVNRDTLFKWNQSFQTANRSVIQNTSLCFKDVASPVESCFVTENMGNSYKMTNMDWEILRNTFYDDSNAEGFFKLDWFAKLSFKRPNGTYYFVKSEPWRVYLYNPIECGYPFVPFMGQCEDPVPGCANPPDHALHCVDRLEPLDRVTPNISFTCESGYEVSGDECVPL